VKEIKFRGWIGRSVTAAQVKNDLTTHIRHARNSRKHWLNADWPPHRVEIIVRDPVLPRVMLGPPDISGCSFHRHRGRHHEMKTCLTCQPYCVPEK
jgi:hypothetical protein